MNNIEHASQAKPGNALSIEEAVRRFQGLVYSVAFGILLVPEEALDITQEVFLKASQEQAFLEGAFNQKAWLATVSRNLALNLKRRFFRRAKTLFGLQTLFQTQVFDVTEFVLRHESHEELQQQLGELSEEEREILTLRYAADLSYQEIADTMGIKIGTVMSRLARLREKLGTLLNGENDHE